MTDNISQTAQALTEQANSLNLTAEQLVDQAMAAAAASSGHGDFFLFGLTVFMLACFVGYYVVWRVTPALHSPLMAVTNAVSSVIIVGALIATGAEVTAASQWLGFFGIILASINIFGGFTVTQRMLAMYKKKGK